MNKFNIGGVAEADVIMDSNTWVPRSARLNLTAQLFGRSVNVLEIGGRQEGMNFWLEELLSDYGLISRPKVSVAIALG